MDLLFTRQGLAARLIAVLAVLVGPAVFAHETPDGGLGAEPDGGFVSHLVVPPRVLASVEAVYPPRALAERRDAHVHLELQVDATGHVVDARVLESGGDEFDVAALEAVRHFAFTPATEDGVPVRSFVTYTYAFHLPDPGDGGAPATLTTVVTALRPLSASSSFSVRDRDFALRPIGSVQDILRITPGLVMVQHSGGGKANQYFIRGFDANHGSDVALSLDGVPINMPAHAHGQGYADTSFIIPEVIERVEVTKGTSFASQGDFATGGAINLVSRERFEHSSFGIGFGGSPGRGQPSLRALAIASPTLDGLSATFAAELGQANGPFERPNVWNSYRLFNRLTFQLGSGSTLSLTHLGYGGDWSGSGRIAARAVDQGLITRLGSLDPSEGGDSTRHQLQLAWRLRPDATSELRAMAYLGTYRFNLYSNFTGALNDAVHGDEIEQVDRRVFFGARVSYRRVQEVAGVRFDTTLGAEARNDDVTNQLWHDEQRQRLGSAVRDSAISQTLAGLFLNEEVTLLAWLRLNLGGRADLLSYAVDNRVADPAAPGSGVGSALQVSPKVNVIASPFRRRELQWDVFVNWGHGFHSNDVRGAFCHATGDAPDAGHRGRDRHPRAAGGAVGSGGDAVAARSGQRDGVERRRRHHGGERRHHALGRRAGVALRVHPLARGGRGPHLHPVAVQHRRQQWRRPGARAPADLGGRAIGAPRAGAGRGAGGPARVRHRRSAGHR